MEHLYRIDIEELAKEIYRSVIKKISGHEITYGDSEETQIIIIAQDVEDETES